MRHLFTLFTLFLLLFSSLHGAILDDLVEKIEKQQPKKHHHRYRKHRKRASHTLPSHLSSEAKWQYVLRLLGYYKGPLDGDLYSQRTFDAISHYHRDHNEVPTGFLEPEDKRYFRTLYSQTYLKRFLDIKPRKGRYGKQTLQAALKMQGFYKGKVDGKFGRGSKKALNAYISARSLKGVPKAQVERELVNEARSQMQDRIEKMRKVAAKPPTYAQEGN